MAKDAKLGLVLGIGVVIVIAVVFFRKDGSQAKAATETAAVNPKNTLGTPVISDMRATPASRRHTVVQGDTLFSIAQYYYNDPTKFMLIYDANRNSLAAPDRLAPGTVLVIPD